MEEKIAEYIIVAAVSITGSFLVLWLLRFAKLGVHFKSHIAADGKDILISQADAQRQRREVHFWYWMTMLAMTAIYLLSLQLLGSAVKGAVLSNAVALTSLLVGFLSIIYAYYSNQSSTSNLALVSDVSSSLRANATELVRVSGNVDSQLDKLKNEILEFKSTFAGGMQKLTSTVEARFSAASSEATKSTGGDVVIPDEKHIAQFARASSLQGMYVWYSLLECFAKKKKLNLSKLSQAIEQKGGQIIKSYLHGYLIAGDAANFWDTTQSGDQHAVNHVFALPGKLGTSMREYVLKRSKQIHEDTPELEDAEVVLTAIDKMVEGAPTTSKKA